MKRIILGFLFVFMFCGTVYSMDWSGTYDNSKTETKYHGLYYEVQIKSSNNNIYKVDLSVNETSVRYPTTCYMKNGTGKENNGQLYIYNSKCKHIFTLTKNSNKFTIKVVPNVKGIFTNCVLHDGRKI